MLRIIFQERKFIVIIDQDYPIVSFYVYSLFNVMTSCVKLNITLYYNIQSLLRDIHMTCFNTECEHDCTEYLEIFMIMLLRI